jgi:hypothetical protein
MIRRPFSSRWLPGVITLSALLGGLAAPRPAPAQLSGADLFRANCDGCHELPDPEEPKRSRQQWETIVIRMVKVRGATLNATEQKAVLNYLDSFNREPRQIKWLDAAAKPHKATFAAADAGKLPADWVDLTTGGDTEVPWAVQVDPSTKAAFVTPLKPASEREYPALIDNTGVLNDGTLTTRTQIVSGKTSPGAGILFGFRSPQSYYGARISDRDVVLYECEGGRRALLARMPVAIPLKQWHTLSVELAAKSVKISLDGKPLPSITRALPAYRGGRTGLHTQADTVALFDQWQVDVK